MISKGKLWGWVLCFAVLAGSSASQVLSSKGKAPFVAGEILVHLKETASFEDRAKVLSSLGESRVLSRPDLFKIKLKGQLAVPAAVEQIQKDPSVLFAQPNFYYYAHCAAPVTDMYYASPENWPLVKVQAPQAWALFSTCPPGSTSVTVAVIDSGVAQTPIDLPPGLFVNGYNAVSNLYDATTPNASQDDFGHGTYVTSIIAAQWNTISLKDCNSTTFTTGMAGVAPGVKIMPVKVLDNTGSGTSDSIVAGTNFAVANGARVLNFSLGSSAAGGLDPAQQQALDNALANNCVIVASAGNAAGLLDYPAAYPPVVAVGATDPNDLITCYSNYGPGLDIMAPGGLAHNCLSCGGSCYDPANDIFGAVLECPTSGTSEIARMPGDNNFGTAAGTSASAPFVSGAAALVLSMYPNLTNTQVVQALVNNADSLNGNQGWDPKTGYGRLNIYQALLNAGTGGGQVINYVKTFNSPNPFYPDVDVSTNITLAITQPQAVELTIYDTAGEVVFHKNFAAGELNNNPSNPQFKSYYVPWDGRNGNNQKVKTGIYFYTVKMGVQVGQNKIAVVEGHK